MLVYDHLKCPFCGTLNKFTRGNGRELDKFKCFYCHSWFEKQNDNKYIAVNDRNETKTAEKNFIYTPESCGVVLVVKIEGNKEKLPVATLSFAFGGTYKTTWCQSTLDRFKEGSIRTHCSLMSDQQKRNVLKITVLRSDKNVF